MSVGRALVVVSDRTGQSVSEGTNLTNERRRVNEDSSVFGWHTTIALQWSLRCRNGSDRCVLYARGYGRVTRHSSVNYTELAK